MGTKIDSFNVTVTFNVAITAEDISTILSTAMEGGINYWCCGAIPLNEKCEKEYFGEYASDQIAYGGVLKFILDEPFDENDTDEYLLTLDNMKSGIIKYLSSPGCDNKILTTEDGVIKIDGFYLDAGIADEIVQYALFNEVVFG